MAKTAILAVAASMPTAAGRMLRDGVEQASPGAVRLGRQDICKTIRNLLKRLQNLGCDAPLALHAA